MTTETQTVKPRRRTTVAAHVRMSFKLYRRMRLRAREEGQTFSAWVKHLCVKELRRKRPF